MLRPGPLNLITDICGLTVGHATDEEYATGVTTLLCGGGWPAAVDVRGGGPGTRETDVLAAENLVGVAHAVVLSGGSVFGLAAADGVATELSAQSIGLQLRTGSRFIPIVPAAVLHDLRGDTQDWGEEPPYRRLGATSMRHAADTFGQGSVGAGRGAMAGMIKGGIGSASLDLGDGIRVGALVALNSIGSVLMPDAVTYWAWPFEIDAEFGGAGPPRERCEAREPCPDTTRLGAAGRLRAGANTTLGVVACNADLRAAECKRVAMMAHDGIARGVRPAHTPFDGDTIFAVASGECDLPDDSTHARAAQLARIGSAAADCLTRAIARAAYFGRAA